MALECDYCNPQIYHIYGCCSNCGRKCNPPLYDPNGKMTFAEYQQVFNNWQSDPYWDCGVTRSEWGGTAKCFNSEGKIINCADDLNRREREKDAMS
jgi:hypothetical protein